MRTWPPGSTTKRLGDIHEGDEVLVDLMFRAVASWEDTPEGRVLTFREGVPPRLYPGGLDQHVRVWDRWRYESMPAAMAITR